MPARWTALLLTLLSPTFVCCKATTTNTGSEASSTERSVRVPATDLKMKIAQFKEAKLTADISKLPEGEVAALRKIIEASKLLDPVFERQADAQTLAVAEQLAQDQSKEGDLRRRYLAIMRSPWDRQDGFKPFVSDRPRPPGAGFYPEDLTVEAFRAYVSAHPEKKDELEGLFTMVLRDGDELTAVPYSRYFETQLASAAAKLKEAAALTENASLSRFLVARADAFLNDDYYESDKAWMDLESLVEVTIGPYETYEDHLLGLKASFESFVTVSDPEASQTLVGYKALLPDMEQNLPIPDEVKTVRGSESPIRVVDVVFTSGDARKSVQTIAFNLPNDERVRKEKGAKKVMLRNIIKTKFDEILRPIAGRILNPDQLHFLSAEAFFNQVLFHELSHSLGPAFTTVDGKKVEVRMALQSSYSPLEEGKADVMGSYNVLFMIERGVLPKRMRNELLVSYFAGLFRSVRFGVDEAHGKGAAMQINRFLEAGGATYDEGTGRFTVHFDALDKAIEALVRDVCMLQHRGDKPAVDALLAKYGTLSPPMERALASLTGIPVDIKPIYPLAGGE